MDKWPFVVIIILSWNNSVDVIECLNSVTGLSYENYKILLIDNASNDNTVDVVRNTFSNVQVICNQRNLGFVGGNNVGIQEAISQGADYILLLNDDTVVLPDFLEHLIRIGEAKSDVGIIGPTIVSYFDSAKCYIGGRIDWKSGAGDEIERSPENLPDILETDYVVGCALLIKSHVIRQIGLLDPAYFAYFEDTDWSIRCQQLGYRVVVVPRAKIFHKGSADQYWGRSSFGVYLIRRNQILFMWRYGRWYYWPSFIKQYVRRGLLWYNDALGEKNHELGDAILNGTWAGLTGRYGDRMVKAPIWFRGLIHRHLRFLLWFTSWLYVWDYYKSKKMHSRNAS